MASIRKPRAPRPGEGLFQLSILGGAYERQLARSRPRAEALPWGTLAAARIPPALREEAQAVWVRVALSEHAAAASMAACVLAMVKACAPIDLVAAAARFVCDELSHAELCARVVGELGGAPPLPYDAEQLYQPPSPDAAPLLAACELVIPLFCTDEAMALPLVHAGMKHKSGSPLIDGLLRVIARDEGPHAALGWVFLDWALPQLAAAERRHLRKIASAAVADAETSLADGDEPDRPTLGWLPASELRRCSRRALDDEVRAPLRARGLVA